LFSPQISFAFIVVARAPFALAVYLILLALFFIWFTTLVNKAQMACV